jgi:hypothetical protein
MIGCGGVDDDGPGKREVTLRKTMRLKIWMWRFSVTHDLPDNFDQVVAMTR